jgi:hypothetical protein
MRPSFLEEYGFWDYTTPGAGGMERYTRDDYLLLLDDMAKAGMNSLLVCIKWYTTGYRSKLPYLDQTTDNPVIASDNSLLRTVIEEAHHRGIRVWLGAVFTFQRVDVFGGTPHRTFQNVGPDFQLPGTIGAYVSDDPMVTGRGREMIAEMVTLFPEADGFEIEVEDSGVETPNRIPLYNEWAKQNGRPSFDRIGGPLNPRSLDMPNWRDYATHARIQLVKEIQSSARSAGFDGEFGMICETDVGPYHVAHEVNLEEVQKAFPSLKAITYDYGKWRHRSAVMGFCIDLPKRHNMKVCFLSRGVMTWYPTWPLPMHLEESWKRDAEDVASHKPEGFWWFGSGAAGEGAHVSASRLSRAGFASGVEARRTLIHVAQEVWKHA